MPSEYEEGLLLILRERVPDLTPEFHIQGKGKAWVANLYSENRKLVIEACSRKVERTGRSKSSIQHIEKFYSMLMKLVDMKAANPDITPVMIWSDLVPATSRDLQLASAWGIYVLSGRELEFDSVWKNPPEAVNAETLSHLIRRTDDATPRWHWLWAEQKRMVERILNERASTTNRLVAELGLELNKTNRAKVAGIVNVLIKEGKANKLVAGHVPGEGIVSGTDEAHLAKIEGSLFEKYHDEKRRSRLSHYLLAVIADEEGLNSHEISDRLYSRWKIVATRSEVGGLLRRRLASQGKVHADDESSVARYFLREWWEQAHPTERSRGQRK